MCGVTAGPVSCALCWPGTPLTLGHLLSQRLEKAWVLRGRCPGLVASQWPCQPRVWSLPMS